MATNNISNPFPGIRSYSIDEASVFYGRKKQVNALLNMLTTHRFVALTGASGCGKSSLINAGIISTFNNDESWSTIVFKPGNDPLSAFFNALISRSKKELSHAEIETTKAAFKIGGISFSDFIQQLFDLKHKFLLIVDQFEELFSYTDENSAQNNNIFINYLVEATQQEFVQLNIIVSMRTDFLDECTYHREFNELINQSYYLVPEMTRAEQKEAIMGPIKYFGAEIDPTLVATLLDEVSDKKDQLPVLQHAMMRTWEYWWLNRVDDEPISYRHYQAIGTVSSALDLHAEEVYNSFPDEESKRIASAVFRSLINPNDHKNTRRSATIHDLMNLCGTDYTMLVEVISRFRAPECAFLMPPYHVPINEDTVINISHESIMRIWSRMRDWVQEERSSVEIYLRLANSAQLYQEGKGGLWVNPELHLALAWKNRMNPNVYWGERINGSYERAMTFLSMSSEAYNTEVLLQEERQKHNLKRARFTSLFLGAASLISILFLVFSLNLRFEAEASASIAKEKEHLAVAEQAKAEKQRKQAVIQTRISEQQRQISNQQKLITEAQREYALKQQYLAERQTNIAEDEREKAESAEIKAIESRDEADQQRSKAVEQTIIAKEQRSIAEANEKEAYRLRMITLAKTLSIKANQLYKSQSDELPGLLALQSFRLNKENGGPDYDPDIFNALSNISNNKTFLRIHSDQIVTIKKRNTTFYYSCSKDGAISKWKVGPHGAEQLSVVFNAPNYLDVKSLAVSDDEKNICLGTVDGSIFVLRNGEQKIKPLIQQNDKPINITFFYNSTQILFCEGGKNIFLWDIKSESVPTVLHSFSSNITAMEAWNNGYLFGLENGTVMFFDPSTSESRLIYNKIKNPVTAIGYDSTNMHISIGYMDGSLALFNTLSTEPVEINAHISSVTGISYIHNSNYIATSSLDNTIKIWNIQHPESPPVILKSHDGWVTCLAYNSDYKYLISGGADRNIIIQSVDIDELAGNISNHLTRNLTPTEWNEFIGEDIPVVKTIVE